MPNCMTGIINVVKKLFFSAMKRLGEVIIKSHQCSALCGEPILPFYQDLVMKETVAISTLFLQYRFPLCILTFLWESKLGILLDVLKVKLS